MLQLTFLGTSAGVPTKQRNVTALAIECLNPYQANSKQHSISQNKRSRPWLLIDCGEGTQQQLLHTKLSLQQLLAICITHVHGDHCYGLPGLLASAAMSGRTEPLIIIAPKAIEKLIETVSLTTDLYLPFAIEFIAIEDILSNENRNFNQENSNNVTFHSNGKIAIDLGSQQLNIDITALSHRVPSHAFGITQTIIQQLLNTEKLKANGIAAGRLWGELHQGRDVCTEQGQQLLSADYVDEEKLQTRIVVAGDNDTPACLSTAVQEADLLVHEATYTAEVLTKIKSKNLEFDPMHSSAEQVAKFAENSDVNNLILTHFSARYQSFDNPESSTANMSHIRLEAESSYQGNLWLAADFAQYRVNSADNQVEYLGSAKNN